MRDIARQRSSRSVANVATNDMVLLVSLRKILTTNISRNVVKLTRSHDRSI